MLLGAAAGHSYVKSSTLYAFACPEEACDAEDPDDCGFSCRCVDLTQRCVC